MSCPIGAKRRPRFIGGIYAWEKGQERPLKAVYGRSEAEIPTYRGLPGVLPSPAGMGLEMRSWGLSKDSVFPFLSQTSIIYLNDSSRLASFPVPYSEEINAVRRTAQV